MQNHNLLFIRINKNQEINFKKDIGKTLLRN